MGLNILVAPVGPGMAPDGDPERTRLARDGSLIVGDLHGRYYESASRRNTYVMGTVSGGFSLTTSLSSLSGMWLGNPPGSGYNISILKFVFGVSNLTALVTGAFWWVQGVLPRPIPTEVSGAGIGFRSSSLLSGQTAAPNDVAIAYFPGQVTVSVPTILRASSLILNPYAGTGNPQTLMPPQVEEVAGEFVIPPGYFGGISSIGSSGGGGVAAALVYELVVP